MLFDGFTVGAQALNFLILVYLMWRFLFKPILRAIDEREKHIAAKLADAAAKRTEAQQEHDEYRQKREQLEQKRAELVAQAVDEARAERKRLLDEARQAAEVLRSKQREALRNEAHALNRAIAVRTRQEVFAIAREALTELAEVSLERPMVAVFTRRLRALRGEEQAALAAALTKGHEPALVRSAFDLSAEQRAEIQNALGEEFTDPIRLVFETAPELVCGIELTSNGLKVGWSIAEYLTSLEQGVGQLLDENNGASTLDTREPVAQGDPGPEEAEPEAGGL